MAQMVKNLPATRETWFDPWLGKISWRRACQPISVFLPGEFHVQRSLVGYSPWACKELDMTEWLSTHAHSRVLVIWSSLTSCPISDFSFLQHSDSSHKILVLSGSPSHWHIFKQKCMPYFLEWRLICKTFLLLFSVPGIWTILWQINGFL